MLPKADGQKSSDLYNASGSLNESLVSISAQEVVQISSTVDVKENCTLDAEKGTLPGGNDNQNKTDLFNWEDATEISTEKLGVYGCHHSNNGAEGNKYKCDYDNKRSIHGIFF